MTYDPLCQGLGPRIVISKVIVGFSPIYSFAKTSVAFLRKPERKKKAASCQVPIISIFKKINPYQGETVQLGGGTGFGGVRLSQGTSDSRLGKWPGLCSASPKGE